MNLKHAIKHNGTHYSEGPYPGDNDRLPDELEEKFIERGYFEMGAVKPKEKPELTEAQKIAAMSVDDLTDAIAGRDDEFLNEVLEAETANKDRKSAVKAIESEMDAE